MKTAFEFAQVLEFFEDENASVDIAANPSHSAAASINAGWESTLDPAHLAYLMGQTSVYTHSTPLSTPYSKFKRTYVRPAHTFTIEQAQAFDDIQQWAPDLTNNFNYKELKTNYRLALLKTHPDQGGSSEFFWSVKKSYEVLCSLVKS